MFEKAAKIKREYEKLTAELSDPQIISNNELFQKKARQHSEYSEIVEIYDAYTTLDHAIKDADHMMRTEQEKELVDMAKAEIEDLTPKLEKKREELRIILTPSDPDDKKNAIVEIRAGTGGDEAGIFAGDLYRMYVKYAENHGFSIETVTSSPTELGGFKEIIFFVNGKGAYGKLRYESGAHRVQRVPDTETSGRVHTSAATVYVLPEQEEKEFNLNMAEIRIDVCRASGAGGQHVNRTESAVRAHHIPTGIEVYCQDGRSQIKNKEKALSILSARVKAKTEGDEKAITDSERRSQIGSGDRSEKIRTYNYPQNRVTDHRIGLTSYNLEGVMQGDIDQFIEKLSEENTKKLMEKSI